MTASYRALCSDFYVNQKVSVKLDLPRSRETILELFERVRRAFPSMSAFRRYRDELALESAQTDQPHRWLAVRASNIRSGVVNPEEFDDAYALHRAVLEVAPYFLSISPLDIEYVEILYGFDLAASGNQDALVAAALLEGSTLANLLDVDQAAPIDFQPLVGLLLREEPLQAPPPSEGPSRNPSAEGIEVHFEVKTRSAPLGNGDIDARGEPISIYLTLRRYEPVLNLDDLPKAFDALTARGRTLIDDRVVPSLLAPIRHAIAADGA